MPPAPNHQILFEPVRIGPKTARNRFYQAPHCNGMGHRWPRTMAEMRGVKAEGGWGVVCTEECSVHPSSDLTPATLMRLWDDSDLPVHELMVRKVQEHGALAEHLAEKGVEVVPVTPAAEVSGWTQYTLEFELIQTRLRKLGVQIICNHGVATIGDGCADLACVFTGETQRIDAAAIIPVTARISDDALYRNLAARQPEWADHGVKSVTLIGDALAAGTIAMAVCAGRQFARELGAPTDPDMPFRRENDSEAGKTWPPFGAG